jgi:hypothetical protein
MVRIARATLLYDATLIFGRRPRELLSREGVQEPEVSWRADCVSAFTLTASDALASYDTNPPAFSFYSACASFGLISRRRFT